jgi:ubiquinol-cytochrome c reductase cytochrome c1 subunit
MKVTNACLIVLALFLSVWNIPSHASSGAQGIHVEKVKNDLCDKASLQRGAQLYVNYCLGCHSLQFVRFKEMAKDIGIVDKKGNVLEKLVNSNLNFITDKATDPMQIAAPKKDAAQWFGVAPPDLSLVARSRGPQWLYGYLTTFYEDPKRPWGVNNVVFPDVGMPHILVNLQGTQVPVYKTVTLMDDEGKPYEKQVIERLELKTPGEMTEKEYDKAVTDLVNFLDYVGEPHKLERERLGVWVLLFLVVFTLFAYLLKREYWKDVH